MPAQEISGREQSTNLTGFPLTHGNDESTLLRIARQHVTHPGPQGRATGGTEVEDEICSSRSGPRFHPETATSLTAVVLGRVRDVPDRHDDARRQTDEALWDEHEPTRPEQVGAEREDPYGGDYERHKQEL